MLTREAKLRDLNKHVEAKRRLYGYPVLLTKLKFGSTIKINKMSASRDFRLTTNRGTVIDDPNTEVFLWGKVAYGKRRGELLMSVQKYDPDTEKLSGWDIVVPSKRLINRNGNPVKLSFEENDSFFFLHNRKWAEETL